jgi:hypothetical protein
MPLMNVRSTQTWAVLQSGASPSRNKERAAPAVSSYTAVVASVCAELAVAVRRACCAASFAGAARLAVTRF